MPTHRYQPFVPFRLNAPAVKAMQASGLADGIVPIAIRIG
jgi:hypothetical protein